MITHSTVTVVGDRRYSKLHHYHTEAKPGSRVYNQ